MAREISIGDIHGYSDKLSALLGVIGPIGHDDKLIFIGDYIDRGPDSRGVYQTVRALKEKHGDQVTPLRGNHEDIWFDFFDFPAAGSYPVGFLSRNGAEQTWMSFDWERDEVKRAAEWFYKNTVMQKETERAIYAHAGLHSSGETSDYEMLSMREDLFCGPYHSKTLIVGHTQVRNAPNPRIIGGPNDINAPLFFPNNVVMIDNGCCWSSWRTLVAFDIINNTAYYSSGEIKTGIMPARP